MLTVAIAKAGGRGGFDNHDPRGWLEKQSGRARRADLAHRNHFEAFPFFAAGVLIATHMSAPQARIDELAMVFRRRAHSLYGLLPDRPGHAAHAVLDHRLADRDRAVPAAGVRPLSYQRTSHAAPSY